MRKNKILKKGIILGLTFSLLVGMVPMNNLTATTADTGDESASESSDGTETSSSNQMLHFVMDVRWGNVIGDPTNFEEANFDGSINVSSSARVSLERALLFEKHNNTADQITEQEKQRLSWGSLIYGHWDGVKVLVSSPANDNVTITTTQGDITMTAQELYNLSEPYTEDLGDGREIVVKTYPIKTPKYFLKVLWGKTSRNAYKIRSEKAREVEISAEATDSDSGSGAVAASGIFKRITNGIAWHNASGNFQINDGGTLNPIKALRFEGKDRITLLNSDSKIEWISYVAQGVDGILVRLNLDTDSLDNSDTVTLNFTKADWSKDFNIIDLYHDKTTTATVEGDYGVILQVWRKPNRSLIRVRNKPTVYVVEDGVKKPIPSESVLYSNGLTFNDVEIVEQDEADAYADGEAKCYADGTIVQEEGRSEVYVIANGEKKHIQDPNAFTSLGYNWNSIVKVKPGVLGLYRNGEAMKSNSTYPEGALIREVGKPTVYLVEGGKRKPISSLNIFNARRLDWNKVLVVGKDRVEKVPLANENLKYPDGALVRDPAGKVYKIDQGKKRWIRSGDDLTGAGYKAENIINVTDVSEINDLTATMEGSDIVADDLK